MNDDTARWHRTADLLPAAAGRAAQDSWAAGEQAVALGELVEGLLVGQVPVGAETRAWISVQAEARGVRERITPGLLRCLGDGGPAPVQLLDGEGDEAEVLTGWTGPGLDGLLLVPWIGCTRCGRVLARAHAWDPWDDLSDTARSYVIGTPGRDGDLRVFPADGAGEAFAELLRNCPQA
jgi:hypothetical protein